MALAATEDVVSPQQEGGDSPCVSRPRPPLAGRPKVMVRPQTSDSNALDKKQGLLPQKSLAEKEAEYMAARARIFGTDVGTSPEGPPAPSGDNAPGPMKAELKAPVSELSKDPDYNRDGVQWRTGGLPRGLPAAGMLLHVGGKPPSGPHLPRKRVSADRMQGKVLEWKGKYGWIQPAEPVDHPKAGKHQGKIFVSMIDLVQVTRLEPGSLCHFYLFEDDAGLGAEACMVAGDSLPTQSDGMTAVPEDDATTLPSADATEALLDGN